MYNIIKTSRGGGLDLLPAKKMRKRCGSRAPAARRAVLCPKEKQQYHLNKLIIIVGGVI